MTAPAIAGWLFETLFASTILMAAVLLLRAPVRRAFGPDVAYALWALPLLRMLLPPLPASWREAAAAPITAASETITVYVVEPLSGAAPAAATESVSLVGPIIVGLWIVGAAAFLIWHATAHMRFCRRMLTQQIRGSQIEGGIHLIETEAANGPLAFGVLRKYVAFPRDFVERYDQDERDLALAHELGHHARGDLLANWAALAVLALHWFNPIAWRAFRAFRADQEIANDARVLAGLSAVARHTYACAIVKSAHGGAVSAACHLHTINDLKGRLKMLTTSKTSRSRLIGGTAAVAVLMLAGLGVTASGTHAAETVRTTVEKATGVNLAQFQVVPPAPPEAPEAPEGIDAGAAVEVPPAPPAPQQPWAAMTAPAAAESPTEIRRDVTTTTTNEDGKVVTRVKVVVHDKSGRVRTEDWQGSDDLANIGEVRSANCDTGKPGSGTGKPLVMQSRNGGKKVMIICSNRVQAVTAQATADGVEAAVKVAATATASASATAAQATAVAMNSTEVRRKTLQSALAGLRTHRSKVAWDKNIPAESRAEALEGIDDAMERLRDQISDLN